jgi:hypothetical protein
MVKKYGKIIGMEHVPSIGVSAHSPEELNVRDNLEYLDVDHRMMIIIIIIIVINYMNRVLCGLG